MAKKPAPKSTATSDLVQLIVARTQCGYYKAQLHVREHKQEYRTAGIAALVSGTVAALTEIV